MLIKIRSSKLERGKKNVNKDVLQKWLTFSYALVWIQIISPTNSVLGCSGAKEDFALRTFARKSPAPQIFFILYIWSANKLLMSEMQKKLGVTDFVSEIKR